MSGLVWDIASHTFLHCPSVQGIAIGAALCRYGINRCKASKDEPGILKRIFNGALGGVALCAGGYLAYKGGSKLWNMGIEKIREGYFSQEPEPHLRVESVNPGGHVEEGFHKTKLLWLTCHNVNSLPPYQTTNGVPFLEFSDIIHKRIDHPLEICREVQSALNSGDVQNIVIDSHANWSELGIGAKNKLRILGDTLPDCFKGVSDTAKIILMGCMAGSRVPFLNKLNG